MSPTTLAITAPPAGPPPGHTRSMPPGAGGFPAGRGQARGIRRLPVQARPIPAASRSSAPTVGSGSTAYAPAPIDTAASINSTPSAGLTSRERNTAQPSSSQPPPVIAAAARASTWTWPVVSGGPSGATPAGGGADGGNSGEAGHPHPKPARATPRGG